jgi:predicted signal transduction protein with EAL and GGDEF domain
MMIRITVLAVGIALLLGLLFAALIVLRLGTGLKNLVGTAQAISAGWLETRAAARGRDELTVVARAFNHMTDALLHLERTALADRLTGLGNHRAFQEEFRRETARAHELPADCVLFLNLSPQSHDQGAVRSSNLLAAVRSAGLLPSQVVLEVTERSVARVDTVVREVKRLHDLGFRVALNDVGGWQRGTGDASAGCGGLRKDRSKRHR